MKTMILACRTLEDEIDLAQKNAGTDFPVTYIDSGLHERPKKLADAVREALSSVEKQYGRVLMALGQCGNSLNGICAGDFELILPKVDDCLSLLIGSNSEKAALNLRDKAFFLTQGWLRGESTIMSQYRRSVEKYGEEMALSIMEMMYEHYETMGIIDTGASPIDRLYEDAEEISSLLGLKRKIYKGSVKYIEELLTGPWPGERFIIKHPGEAIEEKDFRVSGQ